MDAMLTIYPNDLAYLSSQRKRSCAGLHRIRQIVAHVAASSSSSFPLAAQLQIQQNLWELNRMFGRCERLKGSCIPPMYTSHVTRLLVFYLVFLPVALANTAGISRTAAFVTTGAVAFAMMGLDEIGHVLEQPFRYVSN
jgi:predicted membrane chloride channel (bestrophin family)